MIISVNTYLDDVIENIKIRLFNLVGTSISMTSILMSLQFVKNIITSQPLMIKMMSPHSQSYQPFIWSVIKLSAQSVIN